MVEWAETSQKTYDILNGRDKKSPPPCDMPERYISNFRRKVILGWKLHFFSLLILFLFSAICTAYGGGLSTKFWLPAINVSHFRRADRWLRWNKEKRRPLTPLLASVVTTCWKKGASRVRRQSQLKTVNTDKFLGQFLFHAPTFFIIDDEAARYTFEFFATTRPMKRYGA